ncbi:MAG: hypothetical protein ACK416_05865, partial [Zestosphaera sp.]
GESTYSSVTGEDLKEVEKFYASFKYLELIEMHESSKLPDDLIRDLLSDDLIGRLERMFSGESQETNTTTDVESSTTQPPTTQTTNTHYEETEKTGVTTLEASLKIFLIIAPVVGAAILLLVILKVRRRS